MQASVFVYTYMHGRFHAGICVCIYICMDTCIYRYILNVCFLCMFPFVAVALNCGVTKHTSLYLLHLFFIYKIY